MRIIGFLACLLVLGGCTVFDAPVFKPSQHETDIKLKVVLTEDFDEIGKIWGFTDIGGMAIFSGNRCAIYIPPLREVRDPYTMCVAGHELFHCILGDFHKKEDGRTCY